VGRPGEAKVVKTSPGATVLVTRTGKVTVVRRLATSTRSPSVSPSGRVVGMQVECGAGDGVLH
jgi:hypothetical protein